MPAIVFHGIITPALLAGGEERDAGDVPFRGFQHRWMHVAVQVWMRVGTPATFIATEDVDHAASVRAGEVRRQMRLHAIPGHLRGAMPAGEAIAEIVRLHFRRVGEETAWLTRLTQEGRLREDSAQDGNSARTCLCSIQDLMMPGCKCGCV